MAEETLHGVTWIGDLDSGYLTIVDQTLLPGQVHHRRLDDLSSARAAIIQLAVRGAPAIGICAAYAAVIHLRQHLATLPAQAPATALAQAWKVAHQQLASSRPTAVNLSWALGRLGRVFAEYSQDSAAHAVAGLLAEAQAIHAEDAQLCTRIAKHGAPLLPAGGTIYTHCNTGALATGGIGTALGCLLAAHRSGRGIRVIAGETRPLLQGSRLTVSELLFAGVPVELACDSAAAAFMGRGLVQAVIVGADRIAANGDTANKIGTYSLAVLAHYHHIPFYVAAPMSSFDRTLADGSSITIEQRAAEEIRTPFGARFACDEAPVLNPAFDVTPGHLITAIITEHGVLRQPLTSAIAGVNEV